MIHIRAYSDNGSKMVITNLGKGGSIEVISCLLKTKQREGRFKNKISGLQFQMSMLS